MDFLQVAVPLGHVSCVGRLMPTAQRAALIVVTGAYPPRAHLHELVDNFPDREVLVVNLPGMFCPPLTSNTFGDFAEAFERALERLLPGRRRVVLGVSAGVLAALPLRAEARVLAEPFFSTAKLTWLMDYLQDQVRSDTRAVVAPYVAQLFGVTASDVEDRNFEHLLTGAAGPLWAVLGDPAGPGPGEELPSFTDQHDRELLRAAGARIVDAPPGSGHGFIDRKEGRAVVLRVLAEALQAAEVTPAA